MNITEGASGAMKTVETGCEFMFSVDTLNSSLISPNARSFFSSNFGENRRGQWWRWRHLNYYIIGRWLRSMFRDSRTDPSQIKYFFPFIISPAFMARIVSSSSSNPHTMNWLAFAINVHKYLCDCVAFNWLISFTISFAAFHPLASAKNVAYALVFGRFDSNFRSLRSWESICAV